MSISRDQPRCFEFQFVHISTSRCTFLQFFRRSEIRSIKTKNRNCPSACTRKARTISLTTGRRVFCRRRTTTAEDNFTCLKEIRRCKPKKKKNPYLAQTNRPTPEPDIKSSNPEENVTDNLPPPPKSSARLSSSPRTPVLTSPSRAPTARIQSRGPAALGGSHIRAERGN